MNLYELKELICFPSSLYSSTLKLQGNQIVLPEYYAQAYEEDGVDGLFVQISKLQNEESKESIIKYAFVHETSATKQACFLSDDIFQYLKVKQGDKVKVLLLKHYIKASQVYLKCTSLQTKQEFTERLQEIEGLLYQEIHKYRCLQKYDIIRLQQNINLTVEDLVPNKEFLCLNETDVEFIINFGEYDEQSEFQVSEKKNGQINSQTKTVQAIIIGTGEIIQTTPIQQKESYNPRLNKIKKN